MEPCRDNFVWHLEDSVHVYLMFTDSNAICAVLVSIAYLLQDAVVCMLIIHNKTTLYVIMALSFQPVVAVLRAQVVLYVIERVECAIV